MLTSVYISVTHIKTAIFHILLLLLLHLYTQPLEHLYFMYFDGEIQKLHVMLKMNYFKF